MNSDQVPLENYSFIDGGLFRKVQVKLGLQNSQGKLALAGLCFAWLPLAILTAINGTLNSGVSIPFLHDVAMNARLLIALPLLIVIRSTIDIKTTAVTKYILDSLLDSDERQKMLSVTLPRMRRLACSSLTEFILLLIVVGSVMGLVKSGVYGGLQNGVTNWKFIGLPEDSLMSLAGKWAVFVAVPFFQFLLLQWIWRYIVWILLIFQIARLPLKLMPTHADRSGGLGIIILAQRSFNIFFVACSVVISSQLIAQLSNDPNSINTIRAIVIGYIVVSLLLVLLPLFFFTGKLVKTKQLGMLKLSRLASELSSRFEQDWLNDIPLEKRIEKKQVDPSMTYDYASMYELLQQLRVIPITLRDILSLVATLFVPFIPILFIYFSAKELLQKILGLLM